MHTLEIHLTAVMLKCLAASCNVGFIFLAEAKQSIPILYALNQLNDGNFCVVKNQNIQIETASFKCD